ncbi:MAG: agmatinase, partial [Deltaproteobacteria bacterium]|nr:agmatinase [Deltaproteobacteria bacterium]
LSYRAGSRNGPMAIISASKALEFYDIELNTSPYKTGIYTADELEPVMSSPEKMISVIEEASKKFIRDNKFLITIGGEHSISTGIIRNFIKKYKRLSVLQIDAHSDLRDTYEGTKYNHACVMRRIRELCPAVQVGIRSMSEEEAIYVKRNKIRIFYADLIREKQDYISDVLRLLTEDVYITIDLDGLDPSVMPAVGTPEPGGMLWYDILFLLKEVFASKNVVGADVVELSPLPPDVSSDFLAAKLIYKLIGYRYFLRRHS